MFAWLAAGAKRIQLQGRKAPTADGEDEASEEAETATVPEGGQAPLSNAVDFNPMPPGSRVPIESPESVFAEIGESLRKRREMLSLTYEEVERHTRVRKTFLQALEKGVLEDMPSPVQTRGILANYAAFLDLDVDAILLRFADGLQARHREQRMNMPPRSRAPMTVNTSLPPLRSFIASDLLFGGGVAIMLLLFAVWGISRVLTVRSSALAGATAPSISDVLVGTPLPTLAQQVTLIAAQATAAAPNAAATATEVLPTLGANVSVQLKLTAAARTYMRVIVDGKTLFDGRADPGQTYTYQAAKTVEVLTGNAGALQAIFNGHDMGLLGQFGDVMDLVYTAEGIVTPTSTPAPTRTPTPKLTPTPSETATPTPSVTPKPTTGG